MIKVGFIGLTQKTFQNDKEKVYERSLSSLIKLSKKIDFNIIYSPILIQEIDMLENYLEKFRSENVDITIFQTTTFFSGYLGEIIAKFPYPKVLWAIPEPEIDNNLKWNSLCGLNLLSSIIKRCNPTSKFYWVYAEPENTNDFERIIKVFKTIKFLNNLRIGHFIGTAPGFINLNVDYQRIKEKLGVEIILYSDLNEIIKISENIMKNMINEEKIKIKQKFKIKVEESLLDKAISIALAFLKLAERDNIKAFASRCWPDFSQNLSIFPCFSFAFVGDEIPISCEGDILNSIAMSMLKFLTRSSTSVLDLVYFDEYGIVLWHCGNTPFSLSENTPEIDFHFNHPGKGVVINSRFKKGEVTIFAFNQELKNSIVFSGKISYPFEKKFKGSFAYLTDLPQKPKEIFDIIINEGFPHHFTLSYGNNVELIKEIMYWLEIPLIALG